MRRMLLALSVMIVAVAGCGSSRAVTSPARPHSAKTSPLAAPLKRVVARRGENGVYRSIKPGTLVAGRLVAARAFADASYGFGLYLSPGGEGFPAATVDGGKSWRIDGPVFYAPAADGGAGVSYTGIASPRSYFAYGSSAVDVTTDGGRRWWESYLGESVVGVVARPGELIAFVQQTPSNNGSQRADTWVYVSTDGGRVWDYDDLLDAYIKVPQRSLSEHLPVCSTSQIRIENSPAVDGLLGVEVVRIVITNVSPEECTLAGYPAAELLADGRPEPVTIRHGELGPKEPHRVRPVTLAPRGGTAGFGISFTDHPGPATQNDCRPVHIIRITLPERHKTGTISTSIATNACGGRPNPSLYVSPIGAK